MRTSSSASSSAPTIGGAAAVALLLGLDAEGVANAMSIACSMGAGLIEANRTGGTIKRVHYGVGSGRRGDKRADG